jgi:hypothetical protein
VQQLSEQLMSATTRADTAEQQVLVHKELDEELQRLRTEAATLLAARHDNEQQCKTLQEQLAR